MGRSDPPAERNSQEDIKTPLPQERREADGWSKGGWSGITGVIHHGLRWVDAPAVDGPHKTLHNRCRR